MITSDLRSLVTLIEEKRKEMPAGHAMLAGIYGIDASGKGYLAARADDLLRSHGMRTALVNVDGWLNLPSVRFSATDPGRHFYDHALRLDELFEKLILP